MSSSLRVRSSVAGAAVVAALAAAWVAYSENAACASMMINLVNLVNLPLMLTLAPDALSSWMWAAAPSPSEESPTPAIDGSTDTLRSLDNDLSAASSSQPDGGGGGGTAWTSEVHTMSPHIDLRAPLTQETLTEIRSALSEHLVIAFKAQHGFTPERHRELALLLGDGSARATQLHSSIAAKSSEDPSLQVSWSSRLTFTHSLTLTHQLISRFLARSLAHSLTHTHSPTDWSVAHSHAHAHAQSPRSPWRSRSPT